MKQWEKNLRIEQASNHVKNLVDSNNKSWKEFAVNLNAAISLGYITHTPRFELRVVSASSLSTKTLASVAPEKQVAWNHKDNNQVSRFVGARVVQHNNFSRRMDLGDRHSVKALNDLRIMASNLTFTQSLIITKAQRDYLEANEGMRKHLGKDWKVLCSLRRSDTGASAILIREGANVYVTLFEDGTYSIKQHVPEFSGSWFISKRVARDTPLPKPKVVAQHGRITIR